MPVPDWVPQNIPEVYRNQPSMAQLEIYHLTGLSVPLQYAERVLAYLKTGS